MAIRVIVKNPDPILREKCKPVTKFNKNLHKLLDDMAETMYDAPGVGLAAPQIGILKRVIVLDSGEEDGPGLIEIVNPEIIKTSDEKEVGPEGCLSIPSINGEVNRFKAITVKGMDRDGNEVVYEAEDFLARIFQHEIDHLNGVLFTDIAETIYEREQPNNVID
ncbi:peptide deformylase [Chengkuizengella axinellae]|uniref:Peptide deformylase n=1 Tax=Chengkuizengella axinellae TaxID=3064388 RepID=A0ABT9IVH7_9BACL|nr:peptide deformylase [Chengkuizengella sp. 2205SS18-9]MDP5273364.1 peptide deformylase [Chengkuizengella sp. 2205SS18-9]